MSISKRLRFEILRRDGFRCYYCGTRGNETSDGLTVDHVNPTALGGTDAPENLVAACTDCNSGKSATLLDADTVSDVSQSNARAIERERAEAQSAAHTEARRKGYAAQIVDAWHRVAPSYAIMPNGVSADISRWFQAQVPVSVVERAFTIAWSRQGIAKGARFRYAAGVVRRLLDQENES